MAKKRIFDEDLIYAQILRNSEEVKKYLESKRDDEIAKDSENAETITESYKNKLQSVYRIRNNAFALLLRQGYECAAFFVEKEDGQHIFFKLEINDSSYETDAASIKNVLFRDFENVISESFDTDDSEVSLEDVLSLSNNKPKNVAKNSEKVVTNDETNKEIPNAKKSKKTPVNTVENKEYDTQSTEEILDMMSDIKQEKPMYDIPKKESNTDVSNMMPVFEGFKVEDNINNEEFVEEKTIDEVVIDSDTVADFNDILSQGQKEISETKPATSDKKPAKKQTQKDEPVKKEVPVMDLGDDFEIDDGFEVTDTNDNIDTPKPEVQVKPEPVVEVIKPKRGRPKKVEVTVEEKPIDIEEPVVKEEPVAPVEVKQVETPIIRSVPIVSNEPVEEINDEFDFGDDFVIEDETVSNDESSIFNDSDFAVEDTVIDDSPFEIEDTPVQAPEPVKVQAHKKVQAVARQEETQETVIKLKNTEQVKNTLCPYCRSKVEEKDTICPNCGFDLINTNMTESELKEADDSEHFDENDIKRILEEIKADYERAKKEEEEAEEKARLAAEEEARKNGTKVDLSQAPKGYARDNFKDVKMYSPSNSDPIKLKDELVCDIYKIKIMDPEVEEKDDIEEIMHERRLTVEEQKQLLAQKAAQHKERVVRDITVYLYPIVVPENGNDRFTQIGIYIEEDDQCGCYCSDYNKGGTLVAKTQYHELRFQMSWQEGVLTSRIIAGVEEPNIIEAKKIEIRPSDLSVVGYGHPYLTLSIEYLDGTETLHIHALYVPDTEPDKDGMMRCVYILENPKENDRQMIPPKRNSYKAIFGFEDRVYTIGCKDCGNEVQLVLKENKNK